MPNLTETLGAVEVHRLPMGAPDDVTGLQELLIRGDVQARDVMAVMGKTEGNGGVNDFTRGFATASLAQLLGTSLGQSIQEVEARVAFVMSGGTEGVMSPHMSVFSRRPGSSRTPRPKESEESSPKRLTMAVAQTRAFLPEEIGREPMIRETSSAVERACRTAGIIDAADVHFVQVKCPLITSDDVEDAATRGQSTITQTTYTSMAYSRAASSLGVAHALAEVPESADLEAAVLQDLSLYSSVASVSAGVELDNNVVIVFGNAPGASGDLVMDHGVMRDALDADAARDVLHRLHLGPEMVGRIRNVFAKAEADPSGVVRSRRHTMLTDTDISATRHARAAVAAVLASVVGDPMIYVSGGAEHQGPPGGGPVAVIAEA